MVLRLLFTFPAIPYIRSVRREYSKMVPATTALTVLANFEPLEQIFKLVLYLEMGFPITL
jgi:hypothetical protein